MPFFPASQFFDFFPDLDPASYSTTYVENIITLVTTKFDLQIKNIFPSSFPSITEADKYNYFNHQNTDTNFVYITAWQPIGLTVKRISIQEAEKPSPSGQILTLGEDYQLWFGFNGQPIPGFNLPVTHLKLSTGLSKNECLRVWGSYGWQNYYPLDVKLSLCQLILRILQGNTVLAENREGIIMEKTMTTEVRYKDGLMVTLQNYFLSNEFLSLKRKYLFGSNDVAIL